MVGLNNILILSILLHKFEEYETHLKELEDINNNTKNLNTFHKKRIFEIKYTSLLNYYLKSNQYLEGIKLIEEIEKGIQKHQSIGLSNYRIVRFYFGIALLQFYVSNWTASHIYVGKVIELEDGKTSITTVAYSKILDLLLHLEEKNIQYLEYQIVNVQRFLKKNQRFNGEEQLIFKFLNNIIKEKDEEKIRASYQNLKDNIQTLQPNSLFKQLNLETWIETKLIVENESL